MVHRFVRVVLVPHNQPAQFFGLPLAEQGSDHFGLPPISAGIVCSHLFSKALSEEVEWRSPYSLGRDLEVIGPGSSAEAPHDVVLYCT